MVAESPNVRRYGVGLFGRELRAAHGGHRAAVQLGDGNTVRDGFAESFPAIVAPEPVVLGQVRAKRCSASVGTVAGGTRCSADLAMIDTVAELDHLVRGSGRHRESGISGIGIRSLGRFRCVGCGFARRSGQAGAGSEFRLRGLRSSRADIGDAIDTAFHIVGDVQRTVGSDRYSRGAVDGAFGRNGSTGKAVSEDLAAACGAALGESLKDDVVSALSIRRAVPGTVEGDEKAVAVGGGKQLLLIEDHSVDKEKRKFEPDVARPGSLYG